MSKSSLKDEVALEIAAHRDRYEDAAKWLGKFCSPKEWRKRQKAALKKAEVEYAENPTGGRANGISDLKSRIERREKISLQMRLSDVVFYWLERYKGYQSVTAEDGRCILLSALLLLQPNIETLADILPQFPLPTWMPDDPDDEMVGRASAGVPLRLGEYWDRWKGLIRAALKQVRLQYQLEALKESPQGEADLASTKQPGSGGAESTGTNTGKPKRKSKFEKIALISAYRKANATATSAEIGKATKIHESDVRRLWQPINKAFQEGKRRRLTGSKHNGRTELEDESASCKICGIPLRESFECELCKQIITGECQTCHYTNTHPKDAIP